MVKEDEGQESKPAMLPSVETEGTKVVKHNLSEIDNSINPIESSNGNEN